jgi:hypothetical protein
MHIRACHKLRCICVEYLNFNKKIDYKYYQYCYNIKDKNIENVCKCIDNYLKKNNKCIEEICKNTKL